MPSSGCMARSVMTMSIGLLRIICSASAPSVASNTCFTPIARRISVSSTPHVVVVVHQQDFQQLEPQPRQPLVAAAVANADVVIFAYATNELTPRHAVISGVRCAKTAVSIAARYP